MSDGSGPHTSDGEQRVRSGRSRAARWAILLAVVALLIYGGYITAVVMRTG